MLIWSIVFMYRKDPSSDAVHRRYGPACETCSSSSNVATNTSLGVPGTSAWKAAAFAKSTVCTKALPTRVSELSAGMLDRAEDEEYMAISHLDTDEEAPTAVE